VLYIKLVWIFYLHSVIMMFGGCFTMCFDNKVVIKVIAIY